MNNNNKSNQQLYKSDPTGQNGSAIRDQSKQVAEKISRIKQLRLEKRLTQQVVADMLEIDQSDYSKIERGERGISYEVCKRMALVFDTSMDYISELTDDPRYYPRNEK